MACPGKFRVGVNVAVGRIAPLVLLVLGAPSILGASSIGATTDLDRQLAEARRAMTAGDVDAAIAAAEKAEKAAATRSDVQLLLGRVYGAKAQKASIFSKLSYAKKCRTAFEKAVALDGNNLDARFALFQYYLMAPGVAGGGEEKANAELAEIAKRSKARGHHAEGARLQKKEDVAGAEREYRAGHEADPKDDFILTTYVFFLSNQKKFDVANAACAKTLEADPADPTPHFLLGRIALIAEKDLEAGVAHLDRFLSKEPRPDGPTHADARWRRGLLLEKLGKKDEAKADYRLALQLMPGHQGAAKELKRLGA